MKVPFRLFLYKRRERPAAARRPVFAVEQNDIGPAVAINIEEMHSPSPSFPADTSFLPCRCCVKSNVRQKQSHPAKRTPGRRIVCADAGANISSRAELTHETQAQTETRQLHLERPDCRLVIMDLLPFVVVFRTDESPLACDRLRCLICFKPSEEFFFALGEVSPCSGRDNKASAYSVLVHLPDQPAAPVSARRRQLHTLVQKQISADLIQHDAISGIL